MNKRAIIFGTGSFAEVAHFYLTHDSDYDVVAFTATEDALKERALAGLPVIPFEGIEKLYPPSQFDMFVAVGYSRFNALREKYFHEARSKGYALLSYVCSKATWWKDSARIGQNVFIFEENTIQPFVSIGDGVVLWSGNHVGHHSTIEPFCFVSSHVVISGHCKIGSHSFLGVNATISDGCRIGRRNLIGPNALVQKDTGDDEAWFGERAKRYPKGSGRFFQ